MFLISKICFFLFGFEKFRNFCKPAFVIRAQFLVLIRLFSGGDVYNLSECFEVVNLGVSINNPISDFVNLPLNDAFETFKLSHRVLLALVHPCQAHNQLFFFLMFGYD